ncbi:protein SPIRAL1-like 1 [Carex littledalei]|uniref:Protein SPIRAL1-like 1 n=1 Tax=Carex littledalei TaxID=544730 RepID=A0A833VEC9_9POAL|nr:protein SPIRAL1-like 1 [Carex littledalei]
MARNGRGVSAGGGQSQLGYLFGGSDEPKPTNRSMPPVEKPAPTSQSSPAVDVSKQVPAGIQVQVTETNNYHRADGQNTGNFLTNRPSTKVHSAPGGGSSLGYLFGGGGN